MRFIFPFKDISAGTRIVLYGASQVGYDFYRQILSTDYCEIVAWVDRQFDWWREMNLPVDSPNCILSKSFDLILLTAEAENVAESMKVDLERIGISGERIFWKSDYSIKGNIAKAYDKDRVLHESEDAIMVLPEQLLNEESLDIVIRVMYAKDLLNKTELDKHREMYKRLMMNQNNGKEPTEDMVHAYFTEYDMKRGWKAFDESFCNLIYSVRDNGFDKRFFIPLDSKGCLINGRHRLAAAIANCVPVWIRKYSYEGFHFHFNDEWLKSLGFDNDEVKEVLKEYHRIIVSDDYA